MIFGIGTDIIEIARVRQALTKGPRFKQRVFTQQERDYCEHKKSTAASYAVRFAAKEAVSKAMGTGIGPVAWGDIEVINDAHGVPQVRLYGRAAELQQREGFSRIFISLSHGEEYAVAYVVIEKNGGR